MIQETLNHKIIIAGCARNVASSLPEVIKNIEKIASFFKECSIIISENDSGDNTLDQLLKWKKTSSFNIDILSSSLDIQQRILRISSARNEILKHVASSNFSGYDYILMMDMDEVNKKIKIRKLIQSFSFKHKWDVITANQNNYYYDHFALRTQKYNKNPYSPSERNKWNKGTNLKYFFNTNEKDLKDISPNLGLVPVLSAFGGLAIYKLSLFKGLIYEPQKLLDDKGQHILHPKTNIPEYDCEHVDMHQKMREHYQARIFINTALINYGVKL